MILKRKGLKNVAQLRCVQPTFKYLDVMSIKTLFVVSIFKFRLHSVGELLDAGCIF